MLDSNVSVKLGTLTFVNDSAKLVNQIVEGGKDGSTNGLLENITYDRSLTYKGSTDKFFDGYLDMETYKRKSPIKVEIEAKAIQDIRGLVTKVKANSFGYLYEIGLIKASDFVDVPHVVQPQETAALLVSTTAILTLLSIQLAQATKMFIDDLATISSILAAGVGGLPASLIYATVSATTQAFLIIILTAQITKLLKDIREIIAPPIRFIKGLYLKTMLEKATEFLGFTLETSIPELDQVVAIPSKPTLEYDTKTGIINKLFPQPKLDSGILRPDDFGYYLSDFFTLLEKLFNTRYQRVGNVFHARSENDPYWENNSTYESTPIADKDVSALDQKMEERVYNNRDYKANTFIIFDTDAKDAWTNTLYEGTSVEIIESLKNGDPFLGRQGGLREVAIPYALGNRKAEKNAVETLLDSINSTLSGVINAGVLGISLGGLFPVLNKVFPPGSTAERIGALKTSDKTWTKPKLVYFVNNEIPADHRDKFNAEVLWDTYWNENSFAPPNYQGQKELILKETVKFTPDDFRKVLDNSFYTRPDGRKGRLLKVVWNADTDIAVIDSWVREPYVINLEQKRIIAA